MGSLPPAPQPGLGLSLVQLLRREGCLLYFAGNDMLDGTPVFDIKPYVPAFDIRQTTRVGWFEDKLDQLASTQADGRMG